MKEEKTDDNPGCLGIVIIFIIFLVMGGFLRFFVRNFINGEVIKRLESIEKRLDATLPPKEVKP